MESLPFKSVLVANRGEIAVRIIRTLRELGVKSIAIYADSDADSLHRQLADFAVRLPGLTSAETYLNIPVLIDAIKISGADAVHPGYGFLSENADFVDAVTKSGAKFIGPSAKSMRILGDKVAAKALMKEHKIPTTPGSDGALTTLKELETLVDTMGFPLILKAAAGGGGRGMQIVRSREELASAFETCAREAEQYFGNPMVFAERFIQNPRHIEVQVLCDSHGNGVHLYERDCSVQRRHQKLIEEAPSTFLSENKRAELGAIAVKAALKANYEGVGTVEFICENPNDIYFMEMNTRIQVEHTVTEEITRVDLVREQLLVAAGLPLSHSQETLAPQGWAFECRINAENASEGFRPGPGRITKLRLPQGHFIRVDTHIYEGYEIPSYFDSMIAKVIVWGRSRDEAIERMKRALGELVIEGIPTTTNFHEAVLDHKEFRSGEFNTGFIDKNWSELKDTMTQGTKDQSDASALLAAIKVQDSYRQRSMAKGFSRSSWQMASRLELTNQ